MGRFPGIRMALRRKRLRWVRREFVRDSRGVAAIEFAFIAGFLCVAVVNVTDTSIYLYRRMQVENAALVGAISALKVCDPSHLPATVNCPGLTGSVAAAIQSTSLGTAVTLNGGVVSEGFYCVNAASALQYMSAVSNKPADCSAAGMPLLQPADYVQVTVTYSYSPVFPGISVSGMFSTPIVSTALVRML
jgi:Flp pilus assembly protein TadG